MKRFIIILLAILFLKYNSYVYSQPLDNILANIQQAYENTIDFQADFQQISFIKSIGEEQKASGKVYMKKPGLMRWEYLNPEKQLIILDGKVLWIYSHENKQVIKNDLINNFDSKTPYLFLLGLGKIEDEFNVKYINGGASSKKDWLFLELRPKKEQPGLEKLVLKINPKNFQVEGSSIFDYYGNITSIDFYDIQINRDIPVSLFQYQVSEGIEVIEPPRIQTDTEERGKNK